jgi:hypothetical protein
MYLHITIPNTTSEGDYASELYDDDEEYEVYDLDGSLPNYPDIECTQKGLQCADRTIIMDCSEKSNEPLFIMSCASLLQSDDGENATGHCNNRTPSCILSSQGMTLSLNIKTISNEDSKICKFHSGLRCVNNKTLVACSGDTNNAHYAVSCDGTATSDTGSFLQGHCYENSCMFVIVHQNNNSDILADQSDNFEIYHLLPPDANNATSEPLYSNASTETNTTDIQEEPDILMQQVQVFDLYNEYEDFIHSLSKTEEYLVDDYNDTDIHTANSSSGEHTDLITYTAENFLKTAKDNLSQTDDLTSAEVTLSDIREPATDLELLPPYKENSPEVTKPYGTDLYSEISSTLNLDYIKTAYENNVNTAIPDSKIPDSASQIRSNISETILTQTITQVSKSIPTETISSVPETIPTEIMMPTSKATHTETDLSVPETLPTETMMSISKGIRAETDSPVPETIPTETTTHVSKSSHTETDFSAPETLPTETMAPVLKVIHRKKFSPVPEMIPTETMTPVSKSSHTETDFSVPETLHTETMISVSKVAHRETVSPVPEMIPTETTTAAFKSNALSTPETLPTETITPISKVMNSPPVLESIPTETMIPVSKVSHTEMFSVTENLPTETMISVSKQIHRETVSPVPEMIPTGTTTPVSKSSDTETAFSTPQILHKETLTSVSKAVHRETVSPIPEKFPAETMAPVSKSSDTETTFSVPEILPEETMTPVSKVVNRETVSPVPETTPIETMIPVSKSSHTETGFSAPDTLPTEIIIPVSKAIHRETDSPVPETLPTENMTPASKFIHTESAFFVPKILPTKTTMPTSKDIHRETASPLPETVFAEAINFNSDTITPVSKTTMLILETPLKEAINPVSKPIPILSTQGVDGDSNTELHFNLQALGTVPTAQVASEAITLLPAVVGTGPVRMGTKSPTTKTNQSQHLVSESSPVMNGPVKVADTQQNLGDFQKYACRKIGIQCMDSQTLAACLPDLTLSYTVSCRTLLPYVMSKHHIVYCNHKSDTCALAQLD